VHVVHFVHMCVRVCVCVCVSLSCNMAINVTPSYSCTNNTLKVNGHIVFPEDVKSDFVNFVNVNAEKFAGMVVKHSTQQSL